MSPRVQVTNTPPRRIISLVPNWTWYRAGRLLTRFIVFCTMRIKTLRPDTPDLPGGYILAVSHLSHVEPALVGALIDRKGYVEYVIVGDARRIELPDFKRVRVAGDRLSCRANQRSTRQGLRAARGPR